MKGKIAAYLRIYTDIREHITNGDYKFGDKLPSKRMMAEDSDTSVITVEHAYDLLADEGYIEAKERSGYYVSYMSEDSFPVGEERNIEAFSENAVTDKYEESLDSFPFSGFARTMRRVLSTHGDKILEKSPNDGSLFLRDSISRYLQRSRGIHVKNDQIIIGAGSEYLYGLIVQMLGRERLYALEDPSYEKIRKVYEANGVTCEALKLGTKGIHSSELRNTTADVLHVTPFDSYPSGVTATAGKRREYIAWAEKRGAIIIEDDYASEFSTSSKSEDTLFSLEPERTVIYLNTFTKTLSPAVRIGYMLLPGELADELKRKIDFYSCTVPMFDQYVLAELLNSGDFERHVNRVRRRRRQALSGND
ncbi:MocR-like pyridoxine biosynthesis transcription factor PdxR [Oribacterium sp. WCC10]|uniref:MocR-like pyridoxine biosynthesis transcription factor PdxR n=1 Tax=Oribacterium sp. WCC10 TaxID=1855343 RepID=UPI0008E978F2|nr:PLP-dependent aminotransferase family protein [Oribacterium sp. WCC10]SFG31979.1 GntR family transcriptional regulator / MocR family aminotransferase [Oribacterium sp. WCC10]